MKPALRIHAFSEIPLVDPLLARSTPRSIRERPPDMGTPAPKEKLFSMILVSPTVNGSVR